MNQQIKITRNYIENNVKKGKLPLAFLEADYIDESAINTIVDSKEVHKLYKQKFILKKISPILISKIYEVL